MTNAIPKDIYKVTDTKGTSGSVLFLTADKTEDLEFFYPYYRFTEAGFNVDVVTPEGGSFEGKNGLGLKETMKISDVNPDNYDLLYIPGGKAPAALKKEEEAVELVKKFAATNKPIASICHGPQLLAEAGVIKGKQIAAWPEVKDELNEAGANFVNEATCIDGQFITARWPADLPTHTAKILETLKKLGVSNKKAA